MVAAARGLEHLPIHVYWHAWCAPGMQVIRSRPAQNTALTPVDVRFFQIPQNG